MQVTMVKNIAINKLPPASPTIAEISLVPIPVVVMTQAIIPATAQAAPTVKVLFAVSCSASKNLLGVMRVSLRNRLTTIARSVPMIAAIAMVVLRMKMTSAISGTSR